MTPRKTFFVGLAAVTAGLLTAGGAAAALAPSVSAAPLAPTSVRLVSGATDDAGTPSGDSSDDSRGDPAGFRTDDSSGDDSRDDSRDDASGHDSGDDDSHGRS
jgi:hypothetical protein